jgi:hypothetical protein
MQREWEVFERYVEEAREVLQEAELSGAPIQRTISEAPQRRLIFHWTGHAQEDGERCVNRILSE